MSQPTILYFTGAHCATCKAMTPFVRSAADQYEGRVEFVEVDVADNPGLAADHSVRGIPTVVALNDGGVAGRSVGAMSPGAISQMFDGALSGEVGRLGISPAERGLRLLAAIGVAVIAAVSEQPILQVAAVGLGLYALWDLMLLPCRR